MSLQSDVSYGVKMMIEGIKPLVEKNLREAVSNKMLTLDEEKIPGITKLIHDTIDQGFIEGSDLLVNVIKRHSK
jgi:hypothetical protein